MIKKLLLGLVLIIVVFIGVAAMQPNDFSISRSAVMNAPAAEAFAQVNDFHKWEAWSPWAKMDPQAKNSFSGAPAGTGAEFSWVGNSQVGEGKMTIVESQPSQLVRIKLDFLKPFASTAQAEFTFQTEGAQTRVTWAMSGQQNLICKMISLVFSHDKMVGGEFEKGLASIKSIVESAPKNPAQP